MTSRPRALWVMLASLTATFALSQAFRTVPAMIVARVATEFSLTPQDIGIFAGAFSLAFGAAQLFIGVTLDRFGPRRTILIFFPLTVAGAGLSAAAPNFPTLVAAQVVLGVGGAPAYISTLVFLTRRYPARRFAALSGITMSLGGLGILLTATPLAYVVETLGWRAAFALLAVACAVAVGACYALLDDPPPDGPSETLRKSFAAIGPILRMRQTAGILSLSAFLYGSFLAVRSPWVVLLFTERFGYSLIEAGNVVLAFSIGMTLSPLAFGRMDPGGARRRVLIIALSMALAALYAALGLAGSAGAGVAACLAIALVSGFALLQYPDVRSSYPPGYAGRAIALVNTAMFFGVAFVQWLSGAVAAAAAARGFDPLTAVFTTLAALLTAATLGYWLLPWPRAFDAHEGRP